MLQLKSRTNTTANALKAKAANANANTVRTLYGQGQLEKGVHSLHSLNRFSNSTYACLLQECIQKKNLSKGRLVHAHMNGNKEFKPDVSLLNILLNMYAKCGSVEEARNVFDKIPQRNVVSWTTLIAAYARDGYAEKALGLFYEMQRVGVKPNQFTFTSVIRACTHLGTLKDIHEEVISCGLESHVFVGSSLIDMYAKCGSIENARDVFEKMPHQNVVSRNTMIAGYAQNGCVEEAFELFREMPERNVVSWTTMIAGFMQNGNDFAALELFRQMQLSGMKANSNTFTIALLACASLKTLKHGKETHGFMIRSRDLFDVFVGSALVEMYGKCLNVENARNVFDRMSQRDVVLWNTMIAGYAKNGHVEDANELFLRMPERNVVSWIVMIEGYAQKGLVGEASRLFQKMPERNVVSWNVIIAGYVQNGYTEDALKFFQQMQGSGVKPNSKTFATVLTACGNLTALEHGKEVHEVIIRNALESDIFVNSALLDMYAKCRSIKNARTVFDRLPKGNLVSWNAMIAGYAQNGHVDDAIKLFEKMPEKNMVSWNVIIAGYLQNGDSEEALRLYQQMQLARVKSNSKTFVNVLSGCANLAALVHGKEIHEEIIRSGFHSYVIVQNALIGMYSKCGCPENARILFDTMALIDIVSWNAMMAGYAQNGYLDEALELFQKMPERDMVSWTVMINGYAKKGNIDKALKLFQSIPDHNIISWNVMLAGYAKNGHIDEALKLFEKMPERNVVSWTVIIAGYAQSGHNMEALKHFHKMQLIGVQPNPQTFAVALSICANLATLEQGKQIHESIIRCGFESNVFVSSALVDMYAKCGSLVSACNVFDRMPKQGIVTWNAMIIGYAMHGCGKEALQLFEQMGHTCIKPDHVTFLGILSACSHSGLVNEGHMYFDSMIQYYHITPSMVHYGCMVDLFARAGHLSEAEDFIGKMPVQPDATVWGSLLSACRVHKNIELGERVAKHIFELDPLNATPYVLLSNIYAAAGRCDDIQKVRQIMKDRRIRKNPGCSWIEVNKKVHAFVMGDGSNPHSQKNNLELERLSGQNPYGGCMVA